MDSTLFDDPGLPESRRPPSAPEQHVNRTVLEIQQNHFNDILNRSATAPVSVDAVHVVGTKSTRRSFLDGQLRPIFDAKNFAQLLHNIDSSYASLASAGVFEHIQFQIGLQQPRGWYASSNDEELVVSLKLKEASRIQAKVGTDIGNSEGSGYANCTIRNVFGNAEILSLNASMGNRTRSSYTATLIGPLAHSHLWRYHLDTYAMSRTADWASHEQLSRGIVFKLQRLGGFEAGYQAVWRTVSNMKETASPLIYTTAGDSVKTGLFWSWQIDKRDDSFLPSSGYFCKISQEVAGLLGDQKGDHPFLKSEAQVQIARTLIKDRITFSLGSRAGFIWSPLQNPINIVDRFNLGGPTDVRGFQINSLGPRSQNDALGGDTYLAMGCSVLSTIPKWESYPIRFQWFLNGGSLIQRHITKQSELLRPSVSTGLGLVYNYDVARFELNFTLPLVVRENDRPRKGFQFGAGISFL